MDTRDIVNNLLLQRGGKPLPERVNYIKVEPHDKQKLFLGLDDVREALFGGATGGGKTIALLADALKFVHLKDYSALLLRRNFPDLKQEGGLIDVAHGWLSKTDAKWNEQDKQWNFPSGASLRFGFLDVEVDKYRYQGGEYQYIGFDEVTQFTESAYRYLFSRLRKKASLNVPLRMRAATNPGGVGGAWVYERFIPEDFSPLRAGEMKVWYKTLENGATTAFVPSLLDDNPSLDKEAYLESLMELDEITREQYLKGDWLIQVRGDILYTYSEAHSVISWTQFANIFGEREIPAHWQVQVMQDWGTTPDHPCITSWFATAGRNAPVINGVPLSECVFLYRGLMLTQCTAADVAKEMIQLMKHKGEISRCTSWRMSHEASSERMEYHQQGLPFTNWKTGKTRGIEQLKNAFSLRYTDKPHPFKPTLYGTPRLFLIVDDQELTYPRTDAGLARWRAEIPAYHTKVPKTGEVAVKWEPYPLFNDAVDTMREAAAEYFPSSADLTKAEKLLEKMPDMFKTEELDEHAKVAKLMWLQREAQEQERPKEERFPLW